jgi:predicted CoA-binding protein
MKSIPDILRHSRTIAVVGLSFKTHRASHSVAHYMQAHGYRILPVNPSYAGREILGELVYASLQEAAAAIAPARIDIVDCFRNARDIPPIVHDAIAVGAGCVWMQQGIEHDAAAEQARAAGLDVVMDRCIKVDHAMMAVD